MEANNPGECGPREAMGSALSAVTVSTIKGDCFLRSERPRVLTSSLRPETSRRVPWESQLQFLQQILKGSVLVPVAMCPKTHVWNLGLEKKACFLTHLGGGGGSWRDASVYLTATLDSHRPGFCPLKAPSAYMVHHMHGDMAGEMGWEHLSLFQSSASSRQLFITKLQRVQCLLFPGSCWDWQRN